MQVLQKCGFQQPQQAQQAKLWIRPGHRSERKKSGVIIRHLQWFSEWSSFRVFIFTASFKHFDFSALRRIHDMCVYCICIYVYIHTHIPVRNVRLAPPYTPELFGIRWVLSRSESIIFVKTIWKFRDPRPLKSSAQVYGETLLFGTPHNKLFWNCFNTFGYHAGLQTWGFTQNLFQPESAVNLCLWSLSVWKVVVSKIYFQHDPTHIFPIHGHLVSRVRLWWVLKNKRHNSLSFTTSHAKPL